MSNEELELVEKQIAYNKLNAILTGNRLEKVKNGLNTAWKELHDIDLEILAYPRKTEVR